MKITDDAVQINLHDSQALIQIINANRTFCAWQRAGGKTGGGQGPRINRLSEVMPRSQCLLFSDTYERLLDRIVPNLVEFWTNKMGLLEGVDFICFKRPPEHWDKPIFPLSKYDKVISFATGFSLCLVSLSVEGSANAFNAQSAIGDEVKFCDEEKIDTEVIPALRGCEKEFGHLPEYLSVWMFTDKYGPKIKWYLRKRKLVNHKAVEMVYVMQMKIFELEAELRSLAEKKSSTATIYKIKNQITELKTKADRIRKHLIYFSDMKPYENEKTVGKFFFKMAKRTAKTEYIFNIAYLNYDPTKIEHTFYPTFTNYNKYNNQQDYNPALPFVIALDYQWRISPMPVVQISKLPDDVYRKVRFVDAPYVVYPLGLEDVVKQFCEKYKEHQKKMVHYIFDHTAIGRNPTKKVFKEVVIQEFINNGWIVIEHYTGDAPDHDLKFENIKPWLTNRAEFGVLVNENTCSDMILSIEQTPAKTISGVTKKDKSSERNLNIPAEETTNFSDSFDQLLWGLFEHNIKDSIDSSGGVEMRI